MATTVKSLDERIDGMADRVDARTERLVEGVANIQGRLIGIERELTKLSDGFADQRAQFVKQSEELAAFRAKTETSLSMIRWFGATLAGLGVLVVSQGFMIAHQAGRLDANVIRQQERLDKTDHTLDELNKSLKELTREIAELRAKPK